MLNIYIIVLRCAEPILSICLIAKIHNILLKVKIDTMLQF